jgi:hypothetical protein
MAEPSFLDRVDSSAKRFLRTSVSPRTAKVSNHVTRAATGFATRHGGKVAPYLPESVKERMREKVRAKVKKNFDAKKRQLSKALSGKVTASKAAWGKFVHALQLPSSATPSKK